MVRFAKLFAAAICAAIVVIAPVANAQSRTETLADIRRDLEILNADIQNLRAELSPSGGTATTENGAMSMLSRLDSLENELRHVTGQMEALQFRVEKIVRDGTNRVGDLEFRLVELEGGDVSQLGETSTLGGETTPPTTLPTQDNGEIGTELAINEQDDFERAMAAFESGDFSKAVDQFTAFNVNYPGGPLTSDASYWRGESLAALDDWHNAARAYLESFSANPDTALAPSALFRLGVSLDRIGQREDACLTLNEVNLRYPGDSILADVQAEMRTLACN